MSDEISMYIGEVTATDGRNVKAKSDAMSDEIGWFRPFGWSPVHRPPVPKKGDAVLCFVARNGQILGYMPCPGEADAASGDDDPEWLLVGDTGLEKGVKGESLKAVLDKVYGHLDTFATSINAVNAAIPSLAPEPATATQMAALKLVLAAEKQQLLKILSEILKNK